MTGRIDAIVAHMVPGTKRYGKVGFSLMVVEELAPICSRPYFLSVGKGEPPVSTSSPIPSKEMIISAPNCPLELKVPTLPSARL